MSLLRPPGARPETDFLRRCIRCEKCAQVCPYTAIRRAGFFAGLAARGTPHIRPREMPCYLCMKCPPVCPSGALDPTVTRKKEDVRMGIARLDKATCIAWNKTLCRSCYQSCPIFDEAITMDEMLRPVVREAKCVGCGICERVCPVNPSAIVVIPGPGG